MVWAGLGFLEEEEEGKRETAQAEARDRSLSGRFAQTPRNAKRGSGQREDGERELMKVGRGVRVESCSETWGGLWVEEFGQDTQCPGRPESPTVPSREQLVTLWAVLAPLHAGLACGETPRHLVSEDLFPVLRPRRSTVSWSQDWLVPGLFCAGSG